MRGTLPAQRELDRSDGILKAGVPLAAIRQNPAQGRGQHRIWQQGDPLQADAGQVHQTGLEFGLIGAHVGSDLQSDPR